MKEVKISVQNVVASVNLNTPISLEKLLRVLPESEYEPEQFPGLVYRWVDPPAATLIFRSGKIICVGAKSRKEVSEIISRAIKAIKKTGVKIDEKKVKINIENIVVSADLGIDLVLDELAFELESSEYEPEQFPGLVYRIYDPKVAFLIFSSGRIVCAGAKTMQQVKKAIKKLQETLNRILKKKR